MAHRNYDSFKEDNNFWYKITNDLSGIITLISEAKDGDTLQKIYDDTARYIRKNYATLNYFTHGRVMLHTFGNNPHTPSSIIYEVVHGITPFRDKELGLEPDLIRLFKRHQHASHVLDMNKPTTTYRNAGQEAFDKAYREEEKARVFFRDNPTAYRQMRNTEVEYPISRDIYARSQVFNPEHVAQLGTHYVIKYFIDTSKLRYNVTYDKNTGTFVGSSRKS